MDQVAQVREKLDIASLISEYIPLKKAGTNFKAVCPFHNEKSPSFFVSPERQIWHCFGCGKGGDAFTFLMEYERIEFPEALRELAKKVGVTLIQQPGQQQAASKKEKIYALNHLASEFYHYVLMSLPAGKRALDYLLEKRKLNKALIKTFGLGFAPLTGEALVKYLIEKKKYKKEDVLEAGLAVERRGRLYDFFSNRIIFPLADQKGDILGFSGRLYFDLPDSPKYINTRDTLVYHKGTHFFGLQAAKEDIKREDKAIIVEGEFDVIACFQHGIPNVIAIKGTAITAEQVALLTRYTKNIALALDQDDAGQQALLRSLPILEKKECTITVIKSPNGKDADESLKESETAFKIAVKHDVNVYDYLLSNALATYDVTTVVGKEKIGNFLIPIFSDIHNEIVKEHYLRKLSTEINTSLETIMREVEKLEKKIVDVATRTVYKTPKKSRKETVELYFLALLFQHNKPLHAIRLVLSTVIPDFFEVEAHEKIYSQLKSYAETEDTFKLDSFLQLLPKELLPVVNTFILYPVSTFETDDKYEEEIKRIGKELKLLSLRNELQELGKQIRDKEISGNEEEVKKLQDKFSQVTSDLTNL